MATTMPSGIKSLLLFAAIAVSSGLASQQEEPPVGASASVIVGNLLSCKEKCEVRFPDGDCQTDVRCLMRNLLSSGTLSFSPSSSDKREHKTEEGGGAHGRGKGEDGDAPGEDKCLGKCVFKDKKDNCRLDLICVLDRDVEGTLRYLVDLDVDAETAIELALGASRNVGAATRRCKEYFKEAACDHPCLFMAEDGDCKQLPDCEIKIAIKVPDEEGEEEEELLRLKAGNNYKPEERVVITRDRPCPGKCEVRDTEGDCVVDYDCVRGEA